MLTAPATLHGKMLRLARPLFLAIMLGVASASLANPWRELTAEDLPTRLQPHAELVLAQAIEGNPSLRASIAIGLLARGEASRARILLQDALQSLPVDTGDPRLEDVRLDLTIELAQMLFEGAGGPSDAEAAVALLAPPAQRGLPPAVQAMRAQMLLAAQLPESERLAGAWGQASERALFRSHADMLAEAQARPPGPPAGTVLGECTNYLGDLAGLLGPVQEAEVAAKSESGAVGQHLQDAHAAAMARDPAPADGSVSFFFDDISAVSLLVLSTLEQGFELRFADAILQNPPQVGIWVRSVPRTLVAAWVLDSFGWRARCAEGWVLIEPDPRSAAARPDAHAQFLGPVLSVEPPAAREGAATGEILWFAGARYTGDIRNGVPHGRGTLLFPNESRLTGEFVDGLAQGEAVRTLEDGHERYRGRYEAGRPHGLGRFVEIDYDGTRLVSEGRFERGALAEGSMDLRSNAAPAVVSYRGPLQRGLPHGEGECSAGVARYRCGFVEGDLVSIGGVGVYPKVD